ncbi:MAG TPA: HAMP domain-containing sensor histidine kinase [Actinomycetota bacterium]
MALNATYEARGDGRPSPTTTTIWQHRTLAILAITLILSALYTVTWMSGGATRMAASWFCLPVIAAGAYMGYVGGVWAAVIASILAGPIMPLEVATGTPQPASLWIGRAVLFVIVGLASAAASSQVRRSYQRQLELAEGSRDLAIRKAAMAEMVSKEFRAPLTVVSSATQALKRDGMVSQEAISLLEGLESGTERLSLLVDAVGTVLEAEDHGSGLNWDTFSVKTMLKRTVDHLGIRDPWSRVTIEIASDAGSCRSDPEFLAQLLQHLLEFAARSSDAEISVRVERPSEAAFTFSVIDHGPGMDERELMLSRDPFSTGVLEEGSKRGTGLGLFAASRLVEVLGGTLTFSETQGGGTTATVAIPATSPEPISDRRG